MAYPYRVLTAALAWCIAAHAAAGPGLLPDEPLVTLGLAKNNVILVLDDSGSMGSEMLLATPFGGFAPSAASGSAVDPTQPDNDFLSQSGFAAFDLWPLPPFSSAATPVRQWGAMYSGAYNPGYYSPGVDYGWPSYGGFTWPDADVTAVCAQYDPNDPFNTATCDSADLTSPFTSNLFGTNSAFPCDSACPRGITRDLNNDGLPDDVNGDTIIDQADCIPGNLCAGGQNFRIESPFYYLPVEQENAFATSCAVPGTCTFSVPISALSGLPVDAIGNTFAASPPTATGYCTTSGGNYVCDCANFPGPQVENTALFQAWEADPSQFTVSGPLVADDFALGWTGQCLTRVDIDASRGAPFPIAGRSFAEELQNFANWLQYRRTKSQRLRAAVATALEDVKGINLAAFWLNGGRPTLDLVDWEVDKFASPSQVLEVLYSEDIGGGTPLKDAFAHSISEFERTDANRPIQLDCQKNYSVLFTDGILSDTFSSVPLSFAPADYDQTAGVPYAHVNASSARWMGDIAEYAYQDLFNGSPPAGFNNGQVPIDAGCPAAPTTPLDCNADPHVNTFAVAFPLQGDILNRTIGGVFVDEVEDVYDPSVLSALNTSSWDQSLDQLFHATINGRGEYLEVEPANPEALVDAFRDLFASLAADLGSITGVASSTGRVTTDTLVFSSTFTSGTWASQFQAFAIDPLTANPSGIAWEAGALLDARGDPAGAIPDRVMLTFDRGAAAGNGEGIPFRWADVNAAVDTRLRDDFLTGPVSSAEAAARLDYIRGDRSNEGSGLDFRERQSRLHDIVGSKPVYVGAPQARWPDDGPFGAPGDRYSSFQSAKAGRQAVIYVGSNGGALHGFVADPSGLGGREIMAYVPAAVGSDQVNDGLHYLTDPFYDHRFYVDGSPVVADVYIDAPATAGNGWRSVLFGTLASGGRGVFAIDVTEPDLFDETGGGGLCLAGTGCLGPEDTVLWEFTSADDARLGLTFAKPSVGLLPDGRWYAVLGNGYNNDASTPAQASLFLLDIEGGIDGWSSADVVVLNVPAFDASVGNGLGSPTLVDVDGDFVFDRAYAGDIQGQMHAFDLSDANPTNWTHDYVLYAPNDLNKPITVKPVVTKNPGQPTAGNEPNLLVMFGTGQYLVGGDEEAFACPGGGGSASDCVQTFNIVWDDQQGAALPTPRGLNDLAQVDIDTTGSGERVIASSPVDFTSTFGCYVSFGDPASPLLSTPEESERVVVDPVRFGDTVLFNTTIPLDSPCEIGGRGFQMFMNYATCTLETPFVDINGDGIVDDADKVSGEVPAGIPVDGLPSASTPVGDISFITRTDAIAPEGIKLGTSAFTGRISWEELLR